MPQLRNIYSPEICTARLRTEKKPRRIISFYRYEKIANPAALRDQLYIEWEKLEVLGRIYLAEEGINAQISIPESQVASLRQNLDSREIFHDIPFKIGLEEGEAFIKLTIKVRPQIVADGLAKNEYDVSNVGTHLSAEQFNQAIESGATVVDMRNHYEHRIGHFENAIKPDVDTFREELPLVRKLLEGQENQKILLYCTGGIRCEKASSYLRHHGFQDVNQLHGGIIQYAHEVKQKGLPSKFRGRNFVFDERRAERITDDVLSKCDQCAQACDEFTNCQHTACNLLFIQCPACQEKMSGCCSPECQKIITLPEQEQRQIRQQIGPTNQAIFKSRQRPKLLA